MTELMNFAQSVAREAGELILCERKQADLIHNYKGGNELVTNADIKAEKIIIEELKKAQKKNGCTIAVKKSHRSQIRETHFQASRCAGPKRRYSI